MRCKHIWKPEWYNDYVINWNCYRCEKCNKYLWKKERFNQPVQLDLVEYIKQKEQNYE